MGRITELIKQQVVEKFNEQKDISDMGHKINDDGLGFIIERSNGVRLIYNGGSKEYKTLAKGARENEC
jgi:hypothetical protein